MLKRAPLLSNCKKNIALALYYLTNITQTLPAYSSSYSQSHTRGKWPIWQFFDVDLMLLTPHGVSKSYFTTKAPIPRSLEGRDQNHPFVQTKIPNISWGGTVPIEVAIIAPMPFMKYTLTYYTPGCTRWTDLLWNYHDLPMFPTSVASMSMATLP